MKKNLNTGISLILILLALFVTPACDKDQNYDEIPYAVVNFRIYPNSTMYYKLNSINGWERVTANYPSRGIIIYRVSMDEFKAYERTCPHDPLVSDARIDGEDFSITVACPTCGTSYILLDGTPFDGPGKRPLKYYRTTYDGNTLRVFN